MTPLATNPLRATDAGSARPPQEGTPPAAESLRWHAAYTRAQRELDALEELDALDALDDVMLPAWRRPDPLAAAREDPDGLRRDLFFPRYILLATDRIGELKARIERLPSIRYLCGPAGGPPSPIPPGQIALVRELVGLERRPELGTMPEKGRRARVVQGPMAGLEGIVVWRNKEKARLATEIAFMGRAVEITAPLDCIVLCEYHTADGEYKAPRRGGRRGRAAKARRVA